MCKKKEKFKKTRIELSSDDGGTRSFDPLGGNFFRFFSSNALSPCFLKRVCDVNCVHSVCVCMGIQILNCVFFVIVELHTGETKDISDDYKESVMKFQKL